MRQRATHIVWDGEPSEVPRHGLLVGVSARLGLILVLAAAVDAYPNARQRRKSR